MRKFKTESKRLLDLMINSIYTNQEIFLRELISNASDAVDKLYFKSLTDKKAQVNKDDLAIHVSFDKDARIITVSDNGIGMTKDELDKNLGTIAHSDSLAFKEDNSDAQEQAIDIIGQFGVGFYSAFMVASQVSVVSKAYGSDEAFEWKSDGIEGYTIEPAERMSCGTDVILKLKEDTEDEQYSRFLDEYALEDLIVKYSNYVRYPIQMQVTKRRELPKPPDAGDDYTPEYESYQETDTINSMIPIWKRSKSDVKDNEYNEFYKSNFHDFSDPMRVTSVHAEGTLTYDALLFIPGRCPQDMYTTSYEKGLALYSSNVLIMDKCDELLGDYFGFVRGIVDSQDLTLNISRETLQHNSQLRAIARKVEKKIKSELEDMRDNNREEYEKFFSNFGRSIKFGVYSSYGQKAELLADLLLFYSAKQEKMITLKEYMDAMGADQNDIYYASSSSIDKAAKLPIVTTVLERGMDVLLCDEDVDEFCLQMMHVYEEKELKNVSSGDLDLTSEEEKKNAEKVAEDNKDLFDAMKQALGDKVTEVKVSTSLTDAPACITAAGPISFEMERVMSQGPNGKDVKSDMVLQINPKHAIFDVLTKAQKDGDSEKISLYANILFNQALLIEGFSIEDPIAYASDIAKLMV